MCPSDNAQIAVDQRQAVAPEACESSAALRLPSQAGVRIVAAAIKRNIALNRAL